MTRDSWVFRAVAIAALVLAGAGLLVTVLQKQDAEDGQVVAQTELADLAAKNRAACLRLGAAAAEKVLGRGVCQQAKEIVERPVEGKPGKPGAQGSAGPQGAAGPAPSASQVAAAVSSYCAGGRCKGSSPSAAQVASAVAAYCNAKGECRGPAGQAVTGEQGEKGPQGVAGAQGPQGEPASGEQVAAAVTAYCGQDSDPCRGKDGAPGIQGPTGEQGQQGIPGPAGPVCEPGSTLQKQQVLTAEAPVTGVWILACVLDDQNP